MTTPAERRKALHDILEQRVLVLDGAMGTMLQQRNLTAADFGGPALEGCNESLNRTRPDVVLGIHRAYLAAGSDAIETNTFNCDRISLQDYGLQNDVYELNRMAAKLARQAADEVWTAEKPRFVIGSMGPTTKSITVVGGVTFPELVEVYYQRASGLLDGGVDILVAETCNDTRAVKAALVAIERLRARARGSHSGNGLRHHRDHRHHARRPDRRRFLRFRAACRPAFHRPQLRHRSGIHDRPSAHHQRDGAGARFLLSQRRICRTEGEYLETPDIASPRNWNVSARTAG